MDIKNLYILLPLLPILYACQTEMPQESTMPKRFLRVNATLPGRDETRAQITYGNPNPEKEIFMWDESGRFGCTQNDYIALYNVSRLSKCPYEGIQLDAIKINGRSATFESVESVDSTLKIMRGDTIFVNYWATGIKYAPDSVSYDPRKVFTIVVGTEANKPQILVKNPNDSSLAYMQHNIKMYDIVTVVEDNKIPDLHFKYLSAILRVTLRNETGKYLYPTKLEFKYPGTESFFNTTLYCSMDPTSPGGLKVYETEFHGGTPAYTDNIGTTINAKDLTEDAGDSIAPGKTYDLYLSTVPRIANDRTGTSLTIDLIKKHQTNHPYRITLDGFNKAIEAGKRYWFNLTAVEEVAEDTIYRKLVLTSDWLDQYPEQDTTSGE